MKRTARFLALAGLAGLVSTGHAAPPGTAGGEAATAAAKTDSAQPAIWLLADSDTRIWMLGTVHILPPSLDWRSADLDAIIERVDELVLETDNGPSAFEKPALMQRLMLRDRPLPLLERIAPEYHNRMRLLAKSIGLDLAEFDAFETWAVTFILMGIGAQGYAGELQPGEEPGGVEIELSEIFDARDKPIRGVETSFDQLGVFRNASDASQSAFLESLIESFEPVEGDGAAEDDALESWLTGDLAAMDAECDEYEELPPETFRMLIVDRNRAWTDWLVERMERPGDILFAVGACHLAGRSSVQRMLEDRGLVARRVH